MTTAEYPVWATDLLEKAPSVSSSIFSEEKAKVTLDVGKQGVASLLIEDGAFSAVVDGDVEFDQAVKIPVSQRQLSELVDGSLALSTAYMKGDIKPEGSSRALMMAVEVFDRFGGSD